MLKVKFYIRNEIKCYVYLLNIHCNFIPVKSIVKEFLVLEKEKNEWSIENFHYTGKKPVHLNRVDENLLF